MFGIGVPEMALIAVLAIIFIGPSRVPEVARTVGKTYRDFKRSIDGLKDEFDTSINEVKKEAVRFVEDDSIAQVKQDMAVTGKGITGYLNEDDSVPDRSIPENTEKMGERLTP